MTQVAFLSATGIVFLIIIAALLIYAFKPTKHSLKAAAAAAAEEDKSAKKPASSAAATLEDLKNLAKTANNKEDLNRIVLNFINTEVLPNRSANKPISTDAKNKLSFISTVCGNPNADAKLISFLVLELGRKYPAYKRELEMYQNIGIAKRRMR